jgi:hypothetical protein
VQHQTTTVTGQAFGLLFLLSAFCRSCALPLACRAFCLIGRSQLLTQSLYDIDECVTRPQVTFPGHRLAAAPRQRNRDPCLAILLIVCLLLPGRMTTFSSSSLSTPNKATLRTLRVDRQTAGLDLSVNRMTRPKSSCVVPRKPQPLAPGFCFYDGSIGISEGN